MTALMDEARLGLDALKTDDEDQLYMELGRRLQAMQIDPSLSGSFAPDLPVADVSFGIDGEAAMADLKSFGQGFFTRVNVQAYQLVCGGGADNTQDRKQVLDAFGVGKEAVAPAIAALLVAQLGIAPAIAAVVAMLIIRLFFRPAYEAMCEVWKAHQPQAPLSTG